MDGAGRTEPRSPERRDRRDGRDRLDRLVRLDRLDRLEQEITACRACPRLVAWREQVGRERRAAFRDQDYWARPVPAFGDPCARIAIVGLAPAAHGGNRTGRMFTGDRSGDFLYAALWRTGFASQPTAVHRDDGLRLDDIWISAAVRCAPPANKPTPAERDRCRPFLERELALLPEVRVFLTLGQFGYQVLCGVLGLAPGPSGRGSGKRVPVFAHGAEVPLDDGRTIVCSYHVSQQNTFTGKLTEPMFDAVLWRARELAGV